MYYTAARHGVLWSTIRKSALLIELTVPWEEWMEEANERKREKYCDLVADYRERWSTQLFQVLVSGDRQNGVCGKLNYLPSERARAEGQRVVTLPTSFPSGASTTTNTS